MQVYSIFDDFHKEALQIFHESGIDVTVHPLGVPRPNMIQMKHLLEEYECVIIGTSQKITEDMFENINSQRIIATASVGLDHIKIPEDKIRYVTVINTPKANAQSVAEYTIGCALSCVKRICEGCALYKAGLDNKKLYRKPEDLSGKTIGIIGAGNISVRIMEYARFFGMNILCWTRNPENHKELVQQGVQFTDLEMLVEMADVISVNLPNNAGTKGIISADYIRRMKSDTVFISVSRLETVDLVALLEKAKTERSFYVCLDLDVNDAVVKKIPDRPNVIITPHIAGGTVETRKRMFIELANSISSVLRTKTDASDYKTSPGF